MDMATTGCGASVDLVSGRKSKGGSVVMTEESKKPYDSSHVVHREETLGDWMASHKTKETRPHSYLTPIDGRKHPKKTKKREKRAAHELAAKEPPPRSHKRPERGDKKKRMSPHNQTRIPRPPPKNTLATIGRIGLGKGLCTPETPELLGPPQ